MTGSVGEGFYPKIPLMLTSILLYITLAVQCKTDGTGGSVQHPSKVPDGARYSFRGTSEINSEG